MAYEPQPHLLEGFDVETRRIMTRRVPLGVSFLVGTVVICGLVELSAHGDRIAGLITSFSVEMVLCAVALLARRQPALQRWIVPIVTATTLGVAACIVAYVVWAGANGDALALALVIYLMGAALLYPWGLRGQVTLVIGVVGAFLVAVASGVPRDLPLAYSFLGVAGGATASLLGAYFLDQLRRAVFHQRRLLEQTRDREMAMLYDVTRTVTSTLDLQQVLRLVCQSVLEALRLQRLWLFWREAPDAELRGLEARRTGDEVALSDLGGEPARWEAVLRSVDAGGPGLVTAEEGALAPLSLGDDGPVRVLRLPLRFRDELVGTILADYEPEASELKTNFLDLAATLGNSAAMAIANARLHALVLQHRAALQRLANKRLDLVEEAMRRISHELHDGTCQALMAVSLDLALLDRRVHSDGVHATVREIRAQVLDVMHGVRQMSHLIHPPVLDDFGVLAAVESIAAKYREASGLDVRVRCSEPGLRFSPAIELLIFRAFQECMSNVVRHAGATAVTVGLGHEAGMLRLQIEDDGRGFDAQAYFRSPPTSAGLGLIGLRERITHFGGALEVTSRPGAGTRLDVRVLAERVDGGEQVATAV